jgi:hypothetical protein
VRISSLIPAIVLTVSVAAVPIATAAQAAPCPSLAVGEAPPALPAYQEQPPPPEANSMWTPGYWGWGPYGYYWVPGTWVPAPAVGLYWTPGYWGFAGAGYLWYPGYWGPSVGFYGGINYGFGYFGVGFVGGVWLGNTFSYNAAVTNVNTGVVNNFYVNNTGVPKNTVSGRVNGRVGGHGASVARRVSFNGGHGGVSARPTAAQRAAAGERRVGSTSAQVKHAAAAGVNRNNLLAFNHGKPPVSATRRPIASADRQPHFRTLSTHDQVVAQNNAASRMRVMSSPVTAVHDHVSTASQHAASHAQVARASIPSRSSSGFSRNATAWRDYNASRGRSYGGYRGQSYGGYRGQSFGGYRGQSFGGYRGQSFGGGRGPGPGRP